MFYLNIHRKRFFPFGVMGNVLASSDVDCWFQPLSMKLVFVASQLTHIIKEKKQRLVRETEGAFTYRLSRETVNIGHLRRRPTKQKSTKQYVYHYTQANTNRFVFGVLQFTPTIKLTATIWLK
jgi:hypothetical protein